MVSGRGLKFDFNLLEDNRVVFSRIKKAIAQEFNKRIQRNITKIEDDIKKVVKELISNCAEIKSIQSGSLRADFGIPADQNPAHNIVSAIVNSVEVEHELIVPKSSGKKFTGGLTVNIQPKDVANLLALSGVTVTTAKGTNLPWLEWLLTLGDKIIITGYHVDYKSGTGRSGRGTMADGDTFRVNPSFSGTTDNNFITRALRGSENRIKNILKRHIG